MKLLLVIFLSVGSFNVFAKTPAEEASFTKVKNLYISHMQKKIIYMSEMTTCMAQANEFKGLRVCSETGKAKIATLDKKAHDAHVKANKKKKNK